MKIAKLKLFQFRNYSRLVLDFHSHFNIFIGKNGVGKTNLLESLYYTAHHKSFRTNDFQSLIQKGKDYYQVKIQLTDQKGESSIKQYNYQEGKKTVYDNNALIKKSHLDEVLSDFKMVLFANNDIFLAIKPPSERRAYFDVILSTLNQTYKKTLSKYHKVLQNRNRDLKNSSPNFNKWDQQIAELGCLIVNARINFLKKIQCVFKNNFYLFNQSATLLPEIIYFSKLWTLADDQNSVTHNHYLSILKQNQSKERYRKVTLVGPHLDDFLFILQGELIKEFASQGQTRIFIYSLKSALLEYIRRVQKLNPVILLDDIFSDLDEERIKLFLNYFKNKGQIFLTCANENLIRYFLKDLLVTQGKVFKL